MPKIRIHSKYKTQRRIGPLVLGPGENEVDAEVLEGLHATYTAKDAKVVSGQAVVGQLKTPGYAADLAREIDSRRVVVYSPEVSQERAKETPVGPERPDSLLEYTAAAAVQYVEVETDKRALKSWQKNEQKNGNPDRVTVLEAIAARLATLR